MCSLDSVIDAWYNKGGVFKCFFKPLPFTTLKQYVGSKQVEDMNVCLPEIIKAQFAQSRVKLASHKFAIVDLPAEASLDFSVLASNLLKFNPVLLFNHLFHKYGAVGSSSLAVQLISYSHRLNLDESDKFMFVLDNNRYNDDIKLPVSAYNNQYELSLEDFPSAEMLRSYDISNIVVVTGNEIKADLQEYLKYLESSNIPVDIIQYKEVV